MNGRRGRISGMDTKGGTQIIKASAIAVFHALHLDVFQQRFGTYHQLDTTALNQLQPFQLDVVAADLRDFVLSLLHKPAVFGASEHLGQPDGHFGGNTALSVYQFRKRVARDAKGVGSIGNGQSQRLDALLRKRRFARRTLSDEVFIGFVVANPEPQKTVGPFEREGAMAQRHSGGVNFLAVPVADFLELQLAMLRISFQQRKLLIGAAADVWL
jgi:hypothetical protein